MGSNPAAYKIFAKKLQKIPPEDALISELAQKKSQIGAHKIRI